MAVQICSKPGNGCENSAGCADRHTRAHARTHAHTHARVVRGGPTNTIAGTQAEINVQKKRKGHADAHTHCTPTHTRNTQSDRGMTSCGSKINVYGVTRGDS